MTFEIKPYPEFAWSISRQRKLDQCPRAYFFTYYAGWNGWLDEAPEEARTAYRLGKLTSLDALLGQQIDERARELQAAARAGHELPFADELEVRTREALRRLWTRSKNGRAAFERRPKSVEMLRSLYLEQDTRPETDRLNEKAAPCLQGLLATSHWERLRACGDAGRVEVPAFASFAHDGIKVFAAPDLAYVAGASCTSSTGRPAARTTRSRRRCLLQMWWALETYPELEGHEIRGYLEYVAAGSTHPVEAAPDFREQAAETVRTGVAQMRALQADPERNIPLEVSAFERRESGLCRSCNFAPLCAQRGPHGRTSAHASSELGSSQASASPRPARRGRVERELDTRSPTALVPRPPAARVAWDEAVAPRAGSRRPARRRNLPPHSSNAESCAWE